MKPEIRRYSKQFYTSGSIQKAVRDYRKIASVFVSEEDGYFVCTFSDCIVDPDRVVREFDNYLIEQMNSRGAET